MVTCVCAFFVVPLQVELKYSIFAYMQPTLLISLAALAAFVLSWVIYPVIYRYAQAKNIVDTPNYRKLQKKPVPLLGGVVIALAMVCPMLIFDSYAAEGSAHIPIVFICLLLLVGLLDDVYNLSASLRFITEVAIVGIYIWVTPEMIDSLHGLWQIGQIPYPIAVILSILAGVGIINSINLIDGIDGYSSGFGIVSCSLLAAVFFVSGNWFWGGLLIIVVAAIIPFFCYNVFSTRKKMFIGDGGTLMIGAILTMAIFQILSTDSPYKEMVEKDFGVVAFCLAVMCIPVFDTLRVMTERICRRVSPFEADKTHLHHLFLEHNLTHLQATCTILIINLLIVGIWWCVWKLGVSIDVQLYVVIVMGILSTFGLSYLLRKTKKNT